MSEQGFNQLEDNQELGTGTGSTIHDDGCAECSAASECVNAGHSTNPIQLNQDLIKNGGYAYNGSGAYNILIWSAITKIYPDMTLAFVNRYPSEPADMSLIDSQLKKGVGVIVGVSFHHNANQTEPDHFVRIYRKNDDGTYQCFDSWAVDGVVDVNFNNRYAVNGMSAANAILEAVSYNYNPITTVSTINSDPNIGKAVQFDKIISLLFANKVVSSDDSSQFINFTNDGLVKVMQSFINDYNSQRNRAGKWDQVCLHFGLKSDSNTIHLQDLLDAINATISDHVTPALTIQQENAPTDSQPTQASSSAQEAVQTTSQPDAIMAVPPTLTNPTFWEQVKAAFRWLWG